MKRIVLYLTLAVCLLLSGCSSVTRTKNSYFALDTVITTEIHAEDAVWLDGQIFSDINALEDLLDSENIPSGTITSEDQHVYQLLGASLVLSRLTDGTFDVSIGAFVDAWGFSDKEYRVPTVEEISEIKSVVGYEKIHETDQGYLLPEGCKITFGGIAKGYISDLIYKRLELAQVQRAIISLGGNIIVYGSNGDDPWKVGIENPEGDGSYVAVMHLTDCFAVTSGDYHRNFISDGVTYHHIIDPATGYPADSDLSSVTIVSKSGVQADAFSTALFVMGSEKAIDFWRASALEFDMVLITKGGEITVTSPLSEKLTDISEEYTLKIIEK